MKKALLIMLALVLITSVAFAQAGVKIGAWGRGFFAVMGSTVTGQNPVVDATIGWWTGNGPRIGISIIGSSENVGFQLDMNADPNGLAATSDAVNAATLPATITVTGNPMVNIGDQAKIWVKPISMLTIQLGYRTYDDALRGNASFGAFNWIRFRGGLDYGGYMPGDGFIFQRVGKAAGMGGDSAGGNFEIALDPVEGLHAFAALTPGAGNTPDAAKAIISNAMYGAGYTIPGIGMIRAQWLGEASNGGEINAAFKLTAVPGLGLDLGTYVGMWDGALGNIAINLTANYAVMPTLSLNVIGSVIMVKATTNYIAFHGGVEGEYALPGDMVITADLRLQGNTTAAAATNWLGWGGLLAIQKNFSNGLVGIGFEVTNIGFAGPTPLAPWVADGKLIGWAVPIRLEYWF